MNELIQLFAVFARIGAVTFGGGYAMLPILQAEVVEKYHWASEEELADYYAVGQCTPGVIAVNTATFIGMKRKGVTGGIIATLGVVLPSLVIITVIAAFLSNFAQLQFVRDAFAGIRVCVCVLIFNAIKKLAKGALVDKLTIGLFLLVMGINLFSSISPAWLVVLAGVVGLLAKKAGGELSWAFLCSCSGNFSKSACSPSAAAWPPFPSWPSWLLPPAGSQKRIS